MQVQLSGCWMLFKDSVIRQTVTRWRQEEMEEVTLQASGAGTAA